MEKQSQASQGSVPMGTAVKLTVTENREGDAGGRTGCCLTWRDFPGDNQQAAKGRAEIRKGTAVLERQETPGQGQRLWREGLDAGGRRLSKPQREKRPREARFWGKLLHRSTCLGLMVSYEEQFLRAGFITCLIL